jgi:hypothetical protein
MKILMIIITPKHQWKPKRLFAALDRLLHM